MTTVVGFALIGAALIGARIYREFRIANAIVTSISEQQRRRAAVCPVCFTVPCICACRAAMRSDSARATHRLRGSNNGHNPD